MADDACDLLCLDLPLAETLRKDLPSQGVLEPAAGRAKGLSDPTRLAVALALHRAGELCVCDLGWVVERSEKLVSHHLRSLRDVALVSSRRDGKMVMYSLTEVGTGLLRAVLDSKTAAA